MFRCPAADCEERYYDGNRWIDHVSDAHDLLPTPSREVSHNAD